eukprot:TRINITY_DN35510_c0_g1_i1.p1 TRINITY_DN35510_c0_g1~~TRINITY_DN35510_c0_g1_i1.p1  ORF type:complete len:223 (-),score=23.00 TRINITY_DN35510_c0_g1_i1:1087-1755(-)
MAPRRSVKYHVANISTGFLRTINVIVVAGAVGSIIVQFLLRNSPSFPGGWGFVGLGVVTAIAGLFGAISSGQGGCFGCHMMCMLISTIGLCAGFLLIFLKFNDVFENLGYSGEIYDAKNYLRIAGAVYFVLFCAQLVIFMLATLIHTCGFIDYYEDLEAQTRPLTTEEEEREQVALEKMRYRHEAASNQPDESPSSARIMSERMKEKYGLTPGRANGEQAES